MSPARLPNFLPLNEARRTKQELLATLTPFQVLVLDTAFNGGQVFGTRTGTRACVTPKGSKNPNVVEGGMVEVRLLVHNGWLRFASGPDGDSSGWFWLTDASKRLWEVLGR